MFDDAKRELVVSSQRRKACAVAATVECPPLFNYFTLDWRPACVSSRRYSAADTAYTEFEVKKLLRKA